MSVPVPSDAILTAAEDLVSDLGEVDTSDREAIVKAVAKFLDDLVPLDKILPSPLGAIAEQHDDKAFEFITHHLLRVFHVDPVKKAERKQRREERRQKRQQRREERQKGIVDVT